jgi:ankyrin repeat protein
MDAEPGVVNPSFPELDCGQSGGRSLLLQGGTLLHVAAEYGNLAAATLLLDRGANVNARATVDEAGIGGQTPIFHAVTQSDDHALAATQLLLERGADLSLRVKIPGSYERPGEIVECTPLGYALLFGGDSQRRTVTLLKEWGAVA